jgi:hypothetical protein
MAYSRFSNSDWHIWVQHDPQNHVETIALWHIIDANNGGPPQIFHRQEVIKMLKSGDFSAVKRFDNTVKRCLERFIDDGPRRQRKNTKRRKSA